EMPCPAHVRWVLVILLVGRASAQPADWSVRRDPFDPVVIARYKQLLARDPHGGALQRLKSLYTRYRSLDRLIAEDDAAPEDHATLVVRARLHADAALWHRVVGVDPNDVKSWLALGALEHVRDPYEEVVARTHDPALARRALRALADLAIAARDHT